MSSFFISHDFTGVFVYKDIKLSQLLTLVKSVRIPSYSGRHFPAFRLRENATRITPNTNTFHAVSATHLLLSYSVTAQLFSPDFPTKKKSYL